MQTSLPSRLSRMPHGRNIKDERNEVRPEISLSTAAVIKLGTRRSLPPRPKTLRTREPTPTHTTRNTREYYKNRLPLCKTTFSQARHVLEGTSHQTRPRIDASDASLLMMSIHYTRLAGASSRSVRACVARDSKREES